MAIRFDASGEYLGRFTDVPDESNFTVCGWARQIVDTNNYAMLAAMDEATLTNFAYIGFDSDGSTLAIFGGGGTVFGSSPAIDTWFFWALTCAGPSSGQLIGYWAAIADAALTATTGGDTNVFDGTEFRIGNNGFDERFNGRIAAVKIWDAVLTPAELLAERWTYVPMRTANLHAWLPMCDAVVADNAIDRSGNARNFSVGGAGNTVEDGPPIAWGARSHPISLTVEAEPPPPALTGGGFGYRLSESMQAPSRYISFFVGLGSTYTLAANPGAYSIAGSAAGLRAARRVAGVTGVYALTGSAAGLRSARRLAGVTGAYSITGSVVTPRKLSRLAAVTGSYAVTGVAAALRAARRIPAVTGAYSITGRVATLRATRRLAAVTGSYAVTGSVASPRATRRVLAVAGAYAVTGSAAALRLMRRLAANAGAYTITGSAATFHATRRLAADFGVYVIGGSPAVLTVVSAIRQLSNRLVTLSARLRFSTKRTAAPTLGTKRNPENP